MDRLFIVMPAYNESDNISNVIAEWYPVVERINGEGNFCRLVVANDGSKDNTMEILSSLMKHYPCLECIDKPNSGHGPTVIHLYKWALEHGADYVFQTDSDGQTIPEEMLPFWSRRAEYDFQIGRRPGRKDGFLRVLVTRCLRISIKLVTGLTVKDANSPFRLMKRAPLSEVVKYVPQDFFLSNIALSVLAVKKGFSVGWPTVSFRTRQGGVSMYNFKKIMKLGLQTYRDIVNLEKSLKESLK